jgi:hypothetical protein
MQQRIPSIGCLKKKYRNVIIEINNETLGKIGQYNHEILLHQRVHELINIVKGIDKNGYRYLVTTSFPAAIVPTKNVIDASDFILFHGNSLRAPDKFLAHINKIKTAVGSRVMPILNNEDDNFNFDSDSSHFKIAIENNISWGFFDYRKKGETNLKEGFQSVPVDWGINSENKKAFFNKVKEITGGL